MKSDVLAWLSGNPTAKRPSKETLNHPGLIRMVAGCDPFTHTPDAFRRAYHALGIDIVNLVPLCNAPPPSKPGEVTFRDDGVSQAYLGVYDTTARVRFPFDTVEQMWAFDFTAHLSYSDLKLPGAQYIEPCDRNTIERMAADIEDVGLYYYQLYTTLFMWGVEALGWEIFMIAAAEEPERFDRHFLAPVFEKTKAIVAMLCDLDTPLVVCHDDIAVGTGPAFHPHWYDQYIFPRYRELWKTIHDHGKQVLFVADGDLAWALPTLRDTGVDAVMFESPATDLHAVVDTFGDAKFIGGIDAKVLTYSPPEAVKEHVEQTLQIAGTHDGFALCCSGGLIGNMPLANLETYFDTRADHAYTDPDWRRLAHQ